MPTEKHFKIAKPSTMGIGKQYVGSKKAVGDELNALIPRDGPWYTKSHLLKLNFSILSLTLYCKSNDPIALGYF